MFSLEMVDTILFVRKFPATLSALKSVLFTTLILQMSVEVIVPIIRSLTMWTRIDTFVSTRVNGDLFCIRTRAPS